ncbi:MAG: phosphoglycerate kinase [Ignavibacteria bacterium RIFOXYB2_FULL_35_12]|nr:MAG: phosphoglycerate kinase [Ignavibacteria bacterium GWA2_36_19]OGU54182.1 MAG: phosphoglycerate kinase [Ignavibacteria bacterium GWC2_35_8]OGU60087.1 MAG: phosphoglycerate kinase [Ignavibacteria bacterium GWF2_35_20]OGU78388.1 MAG: phosphoglycerate kinase [Ignavibacteria bacterium RIFOXYA2_FULL_35_9]OGU83932.1 MAG: phosphoglycerate kinase [Ignavibacteria bacterium RIFOXYA12_FULL_35_25]OGU88167.1 MAG: phosphoglycerate kinase [Ignavibacteria bacterium RIFOXYC12_FULL_35_11]OGU94784.1 MAG: 
MKKLSIDKVDLKNKRVLVRVDFNVPLDENLQITDDIRITSSLPTINKIIKEDGKAILMSHLGRPKGKVNLKYSLKPAAERLSKLLGKEVILSPDCIGEVVKSLVNKMNSGDVLMLENLRFHEEEEKNDEAFAKKLSELGDVYVNDAFGSAHRAHASTEGITKFVKTCVSGYLMQKELDYLGTAIANPQRPFAAVLGGAKISGKIDVISNLLGKVDKLLIGGGMAFTFLKAQGKEIGKSLLEVEKIVLAKEVLEKAKNSNVKFLLPVDFIVADEFKNESPSMVVKADAIPSDKMGLDIGPETIKLFKQELENSKTIVWNGPMGVFEMDNFAKGTFAIAQVLADVTSKNAVTIIGGGDSAAAISKTGLDDKVSHVSTGGGASLEFLEGKVLPGVDALTNA